MGYGQNNYRFIKFVIIMLSLGVVITMLTCGKKGLLERYGMKELENIEEVSAAEKQDSVVIDMEESQEKAISDKNELIDSYQFGKTMNTENKKYIYGNRKILIIVPHEDDELNLCGGMLEQYETYGSDIYITFVTNGDYYDKASTRLPEAVNVLTEYGIPKDHIIFLGYGGGIIRLN